MPRIGVKTKTDTFERVFQKSIELLADGMNIKPVLQAIGMTWGEYWRGVSRVPARREAYVAALESRTAYRKLLAEDRLTEAATTTTREVVAGGEIVSIRADNTPAVVAFAHFMHRPENQEESGEKQFLRSYQQAMADLKARINNPDSGPEIYHPPGRYNPDGSVATSPS